MGACSSAGCAGGAGSGTMMKYVFVTGGNSGIGLALCKQLAEEDGCYVFMGSRSLERGQSALAEISGGKALNIEVIQCDISNQASVSAAAQAVKSKLGAPLYALVNNAGCGLAHGVSADEINDTNFYGTVSMVKAFLHLMQEDGGRIVNVGSGAGPMWLAKQDTATQTMLTSGRPDFDETDKFMKTTRNQDQMHAYGLSKCLLSVYTEWLARTQPTILSSSISPGFIDTKIVQGFGASKPPEEGTVAIRRCLFGELDGNGYFYGSDGLRSPFYPMRNPGQPVFKGVYPWSAVASKYHLQYFDVRGIAETARFMFAVAKEEYVDARYKISMDLKDGKPDFSTIKRPEFDAAKASGELDASCGKVPLLTVDGGLKIGQSKAIERYLAKALGLAGSSDVEAAQIDSLAETVRDIKDSYGKAKGEEATKTKFFAEDLPLALATMEKLLPASSGPWLVGSKISYADIVVYQFLAAPKGFFDDAEKAKAAFSGCARIRAAMDASAANAEIQAWIAKRPATML